VHHDADGLPLGVTYGDAASTTTAFTYDARRRLANVQTARGIPTLWSSPPAGYSAPTSATSQLLLEDLDYGYDPANNPTEIRDWRIDSEWPAGAKPVTREMGYDDLYRLTSIQYRYTDSDDTWLDPFGAEEGAGQQDPRRAQPSPHVAFDNRLRWQAFAYDWLGNTTRVDDDAKGFYDRSLGTLANGSAGAGPYQLRSAAGGAPPRDGDLAARYDDAGNLIALTVTRNAGVPCLPSGASCSQRFAYAWDEVGRLARARRWDGPSLGAVADPLPATPSSADLRYAYDAGDSRVLKTAVDGQANEIHTLYVFASLDVRRTTFDGTDYALTQWTEVPYLFAHGVRLGRVHYAPDDVPALSSGGLHVLLELPDHLGSTGSVIDRATGELVEKATYQAYGGADSDYRPAQWDNFREDYRFTGKEEDVETGLVYFGHRFLSPALMRWASPDPLAIHGLGGDPNAYAYVHGKVFVAVDPVGLDTSTPQPTKEPYVQALENMERAARDHRSDDVKYWKERYETLEHEHRHEFYTNYAKAAGAYYLIGIAAAGGGELAAAGAGGLGAGGTLLQVGASGAGSNLAMEAAQHLLGYFGGYNKDISGNVFNLQTYVNTGVDGLKSGLLFGLVGRFFQAPVPKGTSPSAAGSSQFGSKINTGTGNAPGGYLVKEVNCAFCVAGGSSSPRISSSQAANITGMIEGPLSQQQTGQLFSGLGLGDGTYQNFGSYKAAAQYMRAQPRGTAFGVGFENPGAKWSHIVAGKNTRLGLLFRDFQASGIPWFRPQGSQSGAIVWVFKFF
jgi:RHS repeat-associated protein